MPVYGSLSGVLRKYGLNFLQRHFEEDFFYLEHGQKLILVKGETHSSQEADETEAVVHFFIGRDSRFLRLLESVPPESYLEAIYRAKHKASQAMRVAGLENLDALQFSQMSIIRRYLDIMMDKVLDSQQVSEDYYRKKSQRKQNQVLKRAFRDLCQDDDFTFGLRESYAWLAELMPSILTADSSLATGSNSLSRSSNFVMRKFHEVGQTTLDIRRGAAEGTLEGNYFPLILDSVKELKIEKLDRLVIVDGILKEFQNIVLLKNLKSYPTFAKSIQEAIADPANFSHNLQIRWRNFFWVANTVKALRIDEVEVIYMQVGSRHLEDFEKQLRKAFKKK